MSLVDVDTWINEYESCERLSHNILSQITQRDNIPKLTEEYSRISGNIRIRLKQFSTELAQLKIKLEASSRSRSITVEEIERRQRQIESLQSKFQQLETRFKSVSPTDRESLLTPSASQLWEDDDDDPPIFNKSNYTVQDLRQQQIQILEDQNKGLDALSQTISRQKNLASRLGMEVEQQNEIVDNIADDMERVDTRVITETQNIQSISRQDSTWGYWIIIITLFVLICIVALV